MTVAALYVDPRGAYFELPDVELWGPEQDARTYDRAFAARTKRERTQ